MSGSKNKFMLRAVLIFILTLGVLIAVFSIIQRNTNEAKGTSYQYDVKRFKKVPASLLKYREEKSISTGLTDATAIAAGSDNSFYVAAGKRIILFTSSGQRQAVFELMAPVTAFTVDKKSRIYVAFKDYISVYDMKGLPLKKWISTGPRSHLTSMAVSGNRLFAADAGQKRVWIYSIDGKLISGIDGRITKDQKKGFIIPGINFSVRLDGNKIQVVDAGRRRLIRYTRNGNYLSHWQRSSMEIEGFSGCCNPICIAVAKDGRIFTAEKGLVRIKEYSHSGKLIAVIAGPKSFKEDLIINGLILGTKGQLLALEAGGRIRVFVKKEGVQ